MKTLILACSIVALASFGLGYWAHHPEPVSVPVQIAQANAKKADTVYRDSVKVLDRWHTKYVPTKARVDTALDWLDTLTADLATDTTPHPNVDSIRDRLVIVRAGLKVADSTINHCLGTLTACARSNAAKDTVIKALLADRPARLGMAVDGGYNLTDKQITTRGEASLAMTRHWSVVGSVSLADSSGALRVRQFLFLRYAIR